MAHTVFICHSSKDKAVADAVCTALEAQGLRCWIAPRDARPGVEWVESIFEAIDACQVVLVIFSSHANASSHMRHEIERAGSRGNIIVPFRIEDVAPSRAMEYALGTLHWLNAITPPLERHLAELCRTISRLVAGSAMEVGSASPGASSPGEFTRLVTLKSEAKSRFQAEGAWEEARPLRQAAASPPVASAPPIQAAPPTAASPPARSAVKPGWLTSWWRTLRSQPGERSLPVQTNQQSPLSTAAPSGRRESTQHKLDRVGPPQTKFDRAVGSLQELYRCSAFYPERIEADTVGRIVVSIHQESAAADVVREAARRLDLPQGDKVKVGSAVPAVRLARHASVDITVDVPGLTFDATQATLQLWEDRQFAEFRFTAPAALGGMIGMIRGWVHFWLEGVVLADVAVAILVEAEEVPEIFRNALAESNARPYRFVFPSYSHEDKEAVVRLESYAESFGDTYLRDVRTLRAGQAWNDELRRFIKRANVFQLFWSDNAARSTYVEDEWRCALAERSGRPDPYFVRPIYWTDKPAAIPEELRHIHFAKVPLNRAER